MLGPNQYVPQCVTDRRPLLVWSFVTSGALLFSLLLIAPPLAQANGFKMFSFALYEAFSHLCHQTPERSFFIAGYPFAVCARCTGLYVGFAVAVALYPLLTSLKRTDTPERKWLFIAAAPLAIDFALGFLGIWENTHFSRFSTGAILGAATVFFVMPGLVQLSQFPRLFGGKSAKKSQVQDAYSPGTHEEVISSPSDYSAPLRRI
jgi:uncharacterized membrane protein